MNSSSPFYAPYTPFTDPSKDDVMIFPSQDFSYLNDTKEVYLAKPDSLYPSCNKSLVTPLPCLDEVERLRKERDDAVFRNVDLETELRETQAQLAACRNELEKQKEKHEKQLAFLLFEYLPERQSSPLGPSSLLGPVDHTLHEGVTRAGDYVVGTILGDGHFAQVFYGFHRYTRKTYAIKCLKKTRIETSYQRHQFEQELMVLKHANHPNIIRMQEVLHSPNAIYIIMELGHKDLHTYASNVGITEDSMREIMAGILTPLKYLHSIGICHLDIKPENIMVMKDVPAHELLRENIKLCDFGLCTISSCSTQDPVVLEVTLKGTPGFFAPEMVEGAFDAKPADMWSVGCTLMELSEGFMEGWFESYSVYRTDTADFHQGIRNCLTMVQDRDNFADVHIFELVRDLLRMEPDHRLTAAQVLEHDWFLDDCSQ